MVFSQQILTYYFIGFGSIFNLFSEGNRDYMYVCLHGSRLLIFFFLLRSWKAPHFFNIATKGEAATKTEAILSPLTCLLRSAIWWIKKKWKKCRSYWSAPHGFEQVRRDLFKCLLHDTDMQCWVKLVCLVSRKSSIFPFSPPTIFSREGQCSVAYIRAKKG